MADKKSKVDPMQQMLEQKRARAAAKGFLGFDALYNSAVEAAKQALTPEVNMFNEAGTFGESFQKAAEKLTGGASAAKENQQYYEQYPGDRSLEDRLREQGYSEAKIKRLRDERAKQGK